MQHFAVIMAGGWGERFWPLSRQSRPKQLLTLTGSGKSMLLEAVDRVIPIVGADSVLVATSVQLRDPIQATETGLPPDNVLAEPAKRNTAGAICWVLANILARLDGKAGDEIVAFLTSDHAISTEAQFKETLASAFSLAEITSGIVTIGIEPTRPETGFGYLETANLEAATGAHAYKVVKFHEKPTAHVAATYVADGRYLWNGGMFVAKAESFLSELEEHAPEAAACIHRMADALRGNDVEAAETAFCSLPDISIDYLLMEKSAMVYCVKALFTWDDLGSWDALERTMESDGEGNVIVGTSVSIDSQNNIVYNDSVSTVAVTLGVSDTIVIVTDDAVLVTSKDRAQDVRLAVRKLRETDSPQT